MNMQRYYKAINCSQMTKDLENMPGNELSQVKHFLIIKFLF